MKNKKKLIFLDFDGVVNTIYFNDKGKSTLGMGDSLNNWQAICWLNELYKKVPYSIVVTSSWRLGRSVEELTTLLYKAGLNKRISVLDKTLQIRHKAMSFKLFGHLFIHSTRRGREIDNWLKTEGILYNHYNLKDFIILDDDSDMWKHKKHLVKCTQAGFTINEYLECLRRWYK